MDIFGAKVSNFPNNCSVGAGAWFDIFDLFSFRMCEGAEAAKAINMFLSAGDLNVVRIYTY